MFKFKKAGKILGKIVVIIMILSMVLFTILPLFYSNSGGGSAPAAAPTGHGGL